MKPIHEMIVLVEPDCRSCERVLETAEVLHRCGIVANLIVLNRIDNPDSCGKFGVIIFPAVYINGRLAFYGEFSVEDAQRFAQDSVHN
jgi:predicted thioredoxin/glutaredoxin